MAIGNWALTDKEQHFYIQSLAEHLPSLRKAAGISQGDLSRLTGISRQTYSAVECRKKEMSWSTYLALILFFDYHVDTHEMLRNLPAFPAALLKRINGGRLPGEGALGEMTWDLADILDELDEQALENFRTMLQMEYIRCSRNAERKE